MEIIECIRWTERNNLLRHLNKYFRWNATTIARNPKCVCPFACSDSWNTLEVPSALADGSLLLNLWLPKTYNAKNVKRMNINFFRFPWCCGLFMFEWDRRSQSALNQSPLGRASILYLAPFCAPFTRPSIVVIVIALNLYIHGRSGFSSISFFFFWYTRKQNHLSVSVIPNNNNDSPSFESPLHTTPHTFNALIYYHFISQ